MNGERAGVGGTGDDWAGSAGAAPPDPAPRPSGEAGSSLRRPISAKQKGVGAQPGVVASPGVLPERCSGAGRLSSPCKH